MIRRLAWLFALLSLGAAGAGGARAEDYPLANGSILSGTPIGPNTGGVIIRKADGTLTDRTAWTNFTQAALKQFAADANLKTLIEPFLEPEVEEPTASEKQAVEIKAKIPPRLDRPDPKARLGVMFSSSLAVTLFLLLYAANVYAGYEVGVFRNYPPLVTGGVAVVAPVVGPIVFLCLPTYIPKSADDQAEEYTEEQAALDQAAAEAAAVDAAHAAAPAAPEQAASPYPPTQTFPRGKFTFNRRFFETKFAAWLRVVPGEAEKDLVLILKSARGEHTAGRIARVTPNELYVLVYKGGVSQEVMIPFTEINEVQIKHKDAP